MLAPTVGGYVSTHFGWQWVFIILASVAFANLLVCVFYLPEGHDPDPTVSLTPGPIARNFAAVLKEPQFLTFAVSGAFALPALGSPETDSSAVKGGKR